MNLRKANSVLKEAVDVLDKVEGRNVLDMDDLISVAEHNAKMFLDRVRSKPRLGNYTKSTMNSLKSGANAMMASARDLINAISKLD